MLLSELIPGYSSQPNPTLNGLCEDSRRVAAGDGYVALGGASFDGHGFAASAIDNGAVAVLAERQIDGVSVPVCVVPELVSRRSELAGRVFGNPSREMSLVGVTGTNGKSSVAHYIAQLSQLLGERCGYMGTVGWGDINALADAELTTVDACLVQQRLRHMADSGAQRVAMEVSSHALVQHRVAAVDFDTAIFTNLSRDHLDFHKTLEQYAAAKERLFQFASLQRIITNVDDSIGRQIGERATDNLAVLTYGAESAAITWRNVRAHAQGFSGQWHTAWGQAALELPLLGRFALPNVAAAMAVFLGEGFALDRVVDAAARLQTVPGRMENFVTPAGVNLVVDFAHTPDALHKAAQSLREHCAGRLILVFGCGGDRDRGKRAEMGAIGRELADELWLTNDNPRSEDPQGIVADIMEGAGKQAHVCLDRAQAITQALASAHATDMVLVAGKGHETYQEIGGERLNYSDRVLAARLAGGRD